VEWPAKASVGMDWVPARLGAAQIRLPLEKGKAKRGGGEF